MKTDRSGLDVAVTIWNPVGNGESSFGHVSTDINGKNFSWGPGGYDSRYPSSQAYNSRQMSFRGGKTYFFTTTPQEDAQISHCLNIQTLGSYGLLLNNCAAPIQRCFPTDFKIPGDKVFPSSLGNDLSNSPRLAGTGPQFGPEDQFK